MRPAPGARKDYPIAEASILSDRSCVLEPELPESAIQLHPRYSELLGSLHLVAASVPHHSFNCVFFKSPQISGARPLNIAFCPHAEVLDADERSVADDQGPLEHVAQLTDIAGPFVTAQGLHRFWR